MEESQRHSSPTKLDPLTPPPITNGLLCTKTLLLQLRSGSARKYSVCLFLLRTVPGSPTADPIHPAEPKKKPKVSRSRRAEEYDGDEDVSNHAVDERLCSIHRVRPMNSDQTTGFIDQTISSSRTPSALPVTLDNHPHGESVP